jgi:hypothetical protein
MDKPTATSVTPAPQTASIKKLVFNDVEAAVYLDISAHTLRKWRTVGHRGPSYRKIGKNVRYTLADLEAYIEKQKIAR